MKNKNTFVKKNHESRLILAHRHSIYPLDSSTSCPCRCHDISSSSKSRSRSAHDRSSPSPPDAECSRVAVPRLDRARTSSASPRSDSNCTALVSQRPHRPSIDHTPTKCPHSDWWLFAECRANERWRMRVARPLHRNMTVCACECRSLCPFLIQIQKLYSPKLIF